MSENYQMPHCDQLILHAPDSCLYCDDYPDLQAYRQILGIAFSGDEPTGEQLPCPSTARRSTETINRWPGNRPFRRGDRHGWW